jgi:hypothetical protein
MTTRSVRLLAAALVAVVVAGSAGAPWMPATARNAAGGAPLPAPVRDAPIGDANGGPAAELAGTVLAPLPVSGVATRLAREVFGFLPYWEIGPATDAYLRYDLLSTIGFFGLGLGADGAIDTSTPGYRAYTGDTATTIIRHAHAAGVRTVVTFQSFDADRNAAFLSNTAAQATFIRQALALMARRGADGANIDFEGLSGEHFDEYGAFIGRFRRAARQANPAAQVSVATNSGASGAQMAVAAIRNGADLAFIMGYDYRWSGSTIAGSIAPLVRRDGGASLTRTLDLYAGAGARADHLVLGLPYYGRTWPTATDDLNARRQTDSATFGGSTTFFPRSLPGAAEGVNERYDKVERSEILVHFDPGLGTWFQTYYDSPRSLEPKMRLAIDHHLAGVGLWALGYERGRPGYWELLTQLFLTPELRAATVVEDPVPTTRVTLTLSWRREGSAVRWVRFSNDRRNWSEWRRVASRVGWNVRSAGRDGPRTFFVQVMNAERLRSNVLPVTVDLDRTGPTMTMLRLAFSAGRGAWETTYRAVDRSGVARYEVRFRVDGGPWKTVTRPAEVRVFRIRGTATSRVAVQVRARDVPGTWGAWVSVGAP